MQMAAASHVDEQREGEGGEEGGEEGEIWRGDDGELGGEEDVGGETNDAGAGEYV